MFVFNSVIDSKKIEFLPHGGAKGEFSQKSLFFEKISINYHFLGWNFSKSSNLNSKKVDRPPMDIWWPVVDHKMPKMGLKCYKPATQVKKGLWIRLSGPNCFIDFINFLKMLINRQNTVKQEHRRSISLFHQFQHIFLEDLWLSLFVWRI